MGFRCMHIAALIVIWAHCSPIVAQEQVTFCAVGDVLLDRGIRTMVRRHGPEYPFGRVSEFIRMHDLSFANLEGPMSSRGKPVAKEINFRADSAYVEVLKAPGLDVLSLANNHMLDYGRDALLDTRRILTNNGFWVVGAGQDSTEAAEPLVVERNGLRIGFLAFVTVPQVGIRYRGEQPCPAFPDTTVLGGVLENIRARSDVVVVTFHWGIEYVSRPNGGQTALARFCIDHGADLVLGHHPHVLQSIEKYSGKYIIYSLGNFVFDQHKPVQRESMIFCCSFTRNGVESPYIVPVVLPYRTFRPEFPDCQDNTRIGEWIKKISEGFGVSFRDGDAVYYLE